MVRTIILLAVLVVICGGCNQTLSEEPDCARGEQLSDCYKRRGCNELLQGSSAMCQRINEQKQKKMWGTWGKNDQK